MSTHFSANQYDQAFAAKRLQNWEVPQRFKERPSTLEGFTRIISNDRGHILEGIPRSSKSPWGEFVGTWDMQKPPLRTKTLKTKSMAEKMQDEKSTSPTKLRTPSPQKDKTPEPNQARTPSPSKMRTPTPQAASPTKLRTPTPECAKIRTPTPNGRKSASPVQRKSPELEAER